MNVNFEMVAAAQTSHKQRREALRRTAKILAGHQELRPRLTTYTAILGQARPSASGHYGLAKH